jgi:hypothetical protein
MNYVRRLATLPHAPALGLSLPRATGQNFSVSNEILGTSPCCVRLTGPLSSGAIPQWHPADRRSHASTRYRELEPLPEGAVRHRRHRRSIPLCATFPTSRGDKFTDAVRPPQLPLLRDSKSFVKGISPVAPTPPNSAANSPAKGHVACPQVAKWLNGAYPQAPLGFAQGRDHPDRWACDAGAQIKLVPPVA